MSNKNAKTQPKRINRKERREHKEEFAFALFVIFAVKKFLPEMKSFETRHCIGAKAGIQRQLHILAKRESFGLRHSAKWLSLLLLTSYLSMSCVPETRKVSTQAKQADAIAPGRSDEVTISAQFVADSPIQKDEPHGSILHLFDRSLTGRSFLIAKTRSNRVAERDAFFSNDLWYQDAAGKERFIAREVTRAQFSPDGKKIAYATVDLEIFIETLAGERLAQVSRAHDPKWRSDSAAVSFSVIPSLDYPELSQAAIYDLKSGQITQPTP